MIIITAVMISLIKRGGALRVAGVIKPAEIGADSGLIGRAVALRLFPEFNEAKNVIWHLENSDEILKQVPEIALLNFQGIQKPVLQNLSEVPEDTCSEKCWYILQAGGVLSKVTGQKIKNEKSVEIYVQYFDRNESVPETCEQEKILDSNCVRPVSVREIHRKLKTTAPHFFMQRYLQSQFYLFIEKSAGGSK